jgi:hypothetical protein
VNQIPQPAWACVLAILGTALAVVVLIHPDPQTISLGVLAVASNLVSGALGAFAGHITSTKNATPPADPAQPAKEQ